MQTGHSLYALAWSPDSESVVVGAGRDLAVKGVQVRGKIGTQSDEPIFGIIFGIDLRGCFNPAGEHRCYTA